MEKIEEQFSQLSESQKRISEIKNKAKQADKITYQDFEQLADLVKEFITKVNLTDVKELNLFFSSDIIKKDKEGFFKIISFICNINPEVLKNIPAYQVQDYLIVSNDFLRGVRLIDFFTLQTTILASLITV